MSNRLINEIVELKERKKLLEAVETNQTHIDIFTDEEITEALRLKETNQLESELNRINILLAEDERKLKETHMMDSH